MINFMHDTIENATMRSLGFITENGQRFDLIIIHTNQYFGKKLVINLHQGKTSIMGLEDLNKPNFLNEALNVDDDEHIEELQKILSSILEPSNSPTD